MSNGDTPMREATLDAVRSDQQNLRDSLGEVRAVADSIKSHLVGDTGLKSTGEGPSEARPTPPGMLPQMCELGNDNQQSLNKLMSTLQQISSLTGAS